MNPVNWGNLPLSLLSFTRLMTLHAKLNFCGDLVTKNHSLFPALSCCRHAFYLGILKPTAQNVWEVTCSVSMERDTLQISVQLWPFCPATIRSITSRHLLLCPPSAFNPADSVQIAHAVLACSPPCRNMGLSPSFHIPLPSPAGSLYRGRIIPTPWAGTDRLEVTTMAVAIISRAHRFPTAF